MIRLPANYSPNVAILREVSWSQAMSVKDSLEPNQWFALMVTDSSSTGRPPSDFYDPSLGRRWIGLECLKEQYQERIYIAKHPQERNPYLRGVLVIVEVKDPAKEYVLEHRPLPPLKEKP